MKCFKCEMGWMRYDEDEKEDVCVNCGYRLAPSRLVRRAVCLSI